MEHDPSHQDRFATLSWLFRIPRGMDASMLTSINFELALCWSAFYSFFIVENYNGHILSCSFQVPQPGYDKLSISLISLETGKIVSNTGRASINNGTCQWSDAIFVTTRLEQDAKTGNYHEKMYNLVVSTVLPISHLLHTF